VQRAQLFVAGVFSTSDNEDLTHKAANTELLCWCCTQNQASGSRRRRTSTKHILQLPAMDSRWW
jgi:hypothetical protein